MTDTTFIKFLFREDWTPLKEVLTAYGQEYGQIHEITDEKQLSKLMVEAQPTLIIASVKSKEDIAKIIGFLKAKRRLIKENSIKFSAINFTYNRQVETALMKIGCQEVLDPGIKGKALKYKLDFWKKALTSGPRAADNSKMSLKEKAQEATEVQVKPEGIKWEDSLKCEDDMWLIKAQDHAKKILGKWLVKFMGPSPFVGQWTEATPGKKGIWKYTFKEGIRENFHKTEGNWFFLGDNKPEFVWKENLWMVTGHQIQLVFQHGEEKAIRFTSTQSLLNVCKNSSYAKARENLIIETFDQEVMVKKGLIDSSSTAVDTDNDVQSHYSGKTEGDEPIDGSPMEGKSSTDDLGGNLEGAVGENEEKASGPYSGKSSTDKIDDELDGDAGSDNLGASKYKGKMKFEKTDRKSDYGGESSTDDVGPNHYSNMTKAGEEPLKDKENKLSKDPVRKGEMNGALDTEDLGPSHYSNQQKDSEPHLKDKEHKLQKDRVAQGEMNGDIETEDLGKNHYSNPSEEKKAKSQDSKENKERSGIEAKEKKDGALNGKSETDNLGSSHYGGKKDKQSSSEKEKEALSTEADQEKPVLEADDQEEYFRKMKEKKKLKAEKYKQGLELEEQREAEKKEQERIQKEELEAKKKDTAPENDEESNVVPILREGTKRSKASSLQNNTEAEVDEKEAEYANEVITADARVKAMVRKKDGSTEIEAKVDDFFDGQVIICLPDGHYKVDDNLELSLSFDYQNKIKKIEVRGQCIENNSDGEGHSYLSIKLGEYEAKLFDQFMQLYQLRQKHAEEFLRQAKGL